MCPSDITTAAPNRHWLSLAVAAIALCWASAAFADMTRAEIGFSIPSPPLPRGSVLVAVDGNFSIAPPNRPVGPILSVAEVQFAKASPPRPTGPVLVSIEGGLTVYPQADVNRDMCINVADLLTVRNNLGKQSSTIKPPLADVSPKAPDHPDGIVNVADLLMVRNQLGEGGGCQ